MSNILYHKHIISINDLSSEELMLTLRTAKKLKSKPQPELLKNKVIASCFFEASTRTRLSFETAIHRSGASVVGFTDVNTTSLGKKGETLIDTVSVISKYVDAIIIRHPQEGATRLAAEYSNGIPVLNAGDGTNQHPTQTILDLYTIYETQNRLTSLNIAIIGDLKYGRTVHSLTQALAKFNDNRFFFMCPNTLSMPKYIINMLDRYNIPWSYYNDFKQIMPCLDILYMTRIQKERIKTSEYSNIKSNLILEISDLKKARNTMKILHPLPRANEINTNLDNTPYAEYFHQAQNGLYTRQALLALVLNNKFII
ncbi:aspartate carbamoyltransferase [Candidatus Pantoea edessiphila]|uniref:Aspartate carbamoyltransferase n=1 Tax=Candidatus Pantoea edessiphila TaxID=2044610 RepID=A0A2P5SY71_9GAMM|nr:aspartate carbamoyltransferase [Candidatus Pantoea edessiphila]MBK4775628.1 aspartate carbamoyltransferase [Pantoea sp. Edef]PPI87275.1 aspartate carbamoyltransferase [Candidatus Pantoea edessiphila]